jgi:hypothetical protein
MAEMGERSCGTIPQQPAMVENYVEAVLKSDLIQSLGLSRRRSSTIEGAALLNV